MKTFFKIILLIAAVVVVFHCWPLLAAPLGAAVAVGVIGGGLVVLALLAVAGVGVGALAAILAVATVFLVGLSPLWVPVLLIVGIVSLFRRAARAKA